MRRGAIMIAAGRVSCSRLLICPKNSSAVRAVLDRCALAIVEICVVLPSGGVNGSVLIRAFVVTRIGAAVRVGMVAGLDNVDEGRSYPRVIIQNFIRGRRQAFVAKRSARVRQVDVIVYVGLVRDVVVGDAVEAARLDIRHAVANHAMPETNMPHCPHAAVTHADASERVDYYART